MISTKEKIIIYVIGCHVDKPLTTNDFNSKYNQYIQAGAALTDKRIYPLNDYDNFPESISSRNDRYSEATAMFYIGKNIKSDYIGITHYRRRFALTDNELDSLLNKKPDIITTTATDLGNSIEYEYRSNLFSCDWDLFMNILQSHSPEYYNLAKECFSSNLLHACNINIFKASLYSEFIDWAFPILNDFYCQSPSKTDVYQHRDVGFIAERLSHLFVMKKIKEGLNVKEIDMIELESKKWNPVTACDYSNETEVFQTICQLFKNRQTIKCNNILSNYLNVNPNPNECFKSLYSIFVSAIKERMNNPLSLYEYLPFELRKDIPSLLDTYNTLLKIIVLLSKNKSSEAIEIFNNFIKTTGFSIYVLNEACKQVNIDINTLLQ